LDKLSPHFNDVDLVFHFAANADVRFGTQHPTRDLEQNTIATSNVLECMRLSGCQQIAFSSTGSVYGEAKIVPTPECAPFPVQTSLYGASKLACEGLISAYTEGFGFKGWIFRFVSILGERYTHGHVFDFYKQLLSHPDYLTVLGDGTQKKSYLYIQDCLDAIVLAIRSSDQPVNIFNLGVDAVCQVRDSVRLVCDRMSLNPEIRFSGGDRGWIGDNPMIHLDVSKIEDLGWKPKLTIQESIIRTVEYLDQNHWVLDVR
jgi:UDP-glucose 4-epimerase